MGLQEIEKTSLVESKEVNTWTLSQVEFVEGKPIITPIQINPSNTEDKISGFVVETLDNAKGMLTKLKMPVSLFKSHGQRRGKRELGDIREQREKQIKEVETAISVLDGTSKRPIEFIKSTDGAILGFEIHNRVLPGNEKKY